MVHDIIELSIDWLMYRIVSWAEVDVFQELNIAVIDRLFFAIGIYLILKTGGSSYHLQFNSLRPSDAYMRRDSNHHRFR